MSFVPATREKLYARIALHGPGGAGKTYTGLLILHELCKRVAVIDTERGRSRKYVGINDWHFDIAEPQAFSPESLIEMLAVAASTGHDGIMIDSGSHYWSGKGGMLERVDQAAQSSRGKDTFGAGWKEMSPIEKKMFDAVLAYPGHLVMCLRVKTEYLIEDVEDSSGRTRKKISKMGLRPDQRREFDYEFDLVGAMDARDNSLTVMKSDIITIPQGSVIPKPGLDFADTIGDFCSQGAAATGPLVYRDRALVADATFEGLRGLREEVQAKGLGNAAVVDKNGHATTLDELITARGRELAPSRQSASKPAQAKPKAVQQDPSEALRKSMDYVLAARNADEAAQRLDRLSKREDAGAQVGELVAAVDAEILGISGDLNLLELAERVVEYCERHGAGPRVPQEKAA